MKKILCLVALLALVTTQALATPNNSISVPNSFSALTVAQSSQVNANNNEIQSKFNAHSHTDITQLGTIVTGVWSGTAITTQFGGTGQDFSATAQGNLPYFSALGTISALPPSTAGFVLSTNGVGANPTWISAGSGARDSILRGFELDPLTTTLNVKSGILFHNLTEINIATSTTLNLATAGNWSSGSTLSYGGGAGWCYVGVETASLPTDSGYIRLLGPAYPNRSDTTHNISTGATLIYTYEPSLNKYYRVIGAVRVTSSNTMLNYYQNGNKVIYDVPINIQNGGTSVGSWSANQDCSIAIPSISNCGIFGISVQKGGAASNIFIRPTGSIWENGGTYQNAITAGSGTYGSGQRECFLNTANGIQYYNGAADNSYIDVEGYYLNIR